jgi:hypothetical protein
MRFQVFRDASVKAEAWRVIFDGRLTYPIFKSHADAFAYLAALQAGARPNFTEQNCELTGKS